MRSFCKMVVLSAVILTKSSKMLLARQFVPTTRLRIESLVAAFPKLVEADSQHTFVETSDVRYVFQPLEQLYLLLITNKQSNIMEDLDTLQMMSKLVSDHCTSATEEGVSAKKFELIFAFDEVLALGHKEGVTLQQIKTYLEMDSHEEKLHQIIMESKMNEAREEARRKAEEIAQAKARMKSMGEPNIYDRDDSSSFQSSSSHYSSSHNNDNSYNTSVPEVRNPALSPKPVKVSKPIKGLKLKKAKKTDQFVSAFAQEENLTSAPAYVPPSAQVVPEEKVAPAAATGSDGLIKVVFLEQLFLTIDDDSELQKMEVKGEMKLTVSNPDDSRAIVHLTPPRSDIKFKTPSKVNLDAWNSQHCISLANPDHAWVVGSHKATAVLKWRMQLTDPELIPLRFTLWADQEDDETLSISLEYNHGNPAFNLRDVVLSIPCPNPPSVGACSSNYTYDDHARVLKWQVGEVNSEINSSGNIEFSVEAESASKCHPIAISFESEQTFSGMNVDAVSRASGGEEVEFISDASLTATKFHIVAGDV